MKQRFDEEHNSLYEFNYGLAKARRELLNTRKFRAVAFARAMKINKRRKLVEFRDFLYPAV